MTDQKTIPRFSSYEEEAKWWDTHDPLDYFDTSEMMRGESPRQKKEDVVIIRLDANLKRQLIEDAQRKGIGVSTQGRIILSEYYNRHHT
jgi:hypothetical protein